MVWTNGALSALLAAALLVGCGDEGATLVVDVRTDLVIPEETRQLVVELEGDARRATRDLRAGDEGLAGLRVAEWDLAEGVYTLEVSALDGAGREVAATRARARVSGLERVLVTLSRDCAGVRCDSPGAEACLAGRCVEPECTVGTESCGAEPDCTSAAECEAEYACGGAICVVGACLHDGRGACGAGLVCAPDDGCVVPEGSPDAGAGEDAGAGDAGTDAGIIDAGADDAGAPDAGEDGGPGSLRCPAADEDTVALFDFEGSFDDALAGEALAPTGELRTDGSGPETCGAALAFPAMGTAFARLDGAVGTPLEEGSVDFWVRPGSDEAFIGLLSKDANGSDPPGQLNVQLNPNLRIYARLQGAEGDAVRCSEFGAIRVGEWHHVGLTFGPSGMRLFVDGVEQSSTAEIRRAQRGGGEVLTSCTSASPALSLPAASATVDWYLGANNGFSAVGTEAEIQDFAHLAAFDHLRISRVQRDFTTYAE